MIRIAFFDIDGTLMHMDGNGMSAAMRDTLLALKQKGIRIVIATGRLATQIPDLSGVPFDAYITMNGSFCYTDQEVIFQTGFTLEDIAVMFENARAYDLPIVASALQNRYRTTNNDPSLKNYYLGSTALSEGFPEEKIVQCMVSCRKENFKEILRNTSHARVTDWQGRTADIYPDDSGKDVGVGKVLAHFGLTSDQAIVFGDGNNDLTMFQAVKTSVAMGNATERLKEAATEICPSVYEDGITVYCKEHHLI